MQTILAIDTATEYTSVAVVRGGRVLGVACGADRAARSSRLLGCVDEALRAAGSVLRDVDLFAASIGPGSFTGLRTGLATIKGFAGACAKPILPVPTLFAVAFAEGAPNQTLLVLMPAGRNEVYAQKFTSDEAFRLTESNPARYVAPDLLLADGDEVKDVTLWAGAAARTHADLIRRHTAHSGGALIAKAPDTPYAVAVALWAESETMRDRKVAAADLRALYVRASDAELKEHKNR